MVKARLEVIIIVWPMDQQEIEIVELQLLETFINGEINTIVTERLLVRGISKFT